MASLLPSRTFGKSFGYAQKSLGHKEVTDTHATDISNIADRKVLISVGANDARQTSFRDESMWALLVSQPGSWS